MVKTRTGITMESVDPNLHKKNPIELSYPLSFSEIILNAESANGYNMSLFLCQSFITNINITPAREIPPATSGEAKCPILRSFYQYGAAA